MSLALSFSLGTFVLNLSFSLLLTEEVSWVDSVFWVLVSAWRTLKSSGRTVDPMSAHSTTGSDSSLNKHCDETFAARFWSKMMALDCSVAAGLEGQRYDP